MVEALTKRFRVADKALVVYRGAEIVGVKHADGGSWSVWITNGKDGHWEKAAPAVAKDFEQLPMIGSVEN